MPKVWFFEVMLWPFEALYGRLWPSGKSMSRRPGDLNCHVNAWSLSYYVRHYVSIFWMLITRTHYRSHYARILYILRAYIVYAHLPFAVCRMLYAVCCMPYEFVVLYKYKLDRWRIQQWWQRSSRWCIQQWWHRWSSRCIQQWWQRCSSRWIQQW